MADGTPPDPRDLVRPDRQTVGRISWIYVLLLSLLAGVGYTALYSAAGGSPEPYATKHILRFATGVVLMVGIALVDIRFIARLAWPAYAICVGLLVAVMRMGHVGKGAQRWIDLGGLQLQPSELMKIAPGAGAGRLVPPRQLGAHWQPAVPDPADHRGADPGRADPEGAQSRHRDDHAAGRRLGLLRRGGTVVEVRADPAARPLRRAIGLRPAARLPARPDRHLFVPRERSAGRRLQHHPVQDRARRRRHVGQGLSAGHPGPPELPAGKANRFHLHDDRRGVRLRRRGRGDGPCCA